MDDMDKPDVLTWLIRHVYKHTDSESRIRYIKNLIMFVLYLIAVLSFLVGLSVGRYL